jgi:hypothetical protein
LGIGRAFVGGTSINWHNKNTESWIIEISRRSGNTRYFSGSLGTFYGQSVGAIILAGGD